MRSNQIKSAKKPFRNKNLYIDTSTIEGAGFGLFTHVDIRRGQLICYMLGEIIGESEANLRDKGERRHFFVSLSTGKILDTYDFKCPGKWANDARSKKNNNSQIFTTNTGKRAYLASVKKIKAGSEIFFSYGEQYWDAIILKDAQKT